MTRSAISTNQWSPDLQILDAMNWLHANHRDEWDQIIAEFPDFETLINRQRELDDNWTWLDTDTLGVDADYMTWILEAVEATGLVTWEDGEPWIEVDRDAVR